MADMRISDLPEAPDVNDAQQFEVNDSGNSRRVNFQMLHGELKSRFDGDYAALNHNHNGKYAPVNHTHTTTQIADASAVGRSVLTAADAAAARAAIGAGTSNLALGYSAGQAKPGDWSPQLQDLWGVLPVHKLAPYTAGDGFTVGFIPEFGVSGNQTNWWSGNISIRAASAGSIRIRLAHRRDCVIRINGGDVAYWGGDNPNFVVRMFDMYVNYGDTIQVGLYGFAARIQDVYILTATVAPLMVTAYGFGRFGTPVNPPPSNPPGSGSGTGGY